MCELFAMSSRRPATVNLSLGTLASHSDHASRNKDGWGIAYYQGHSVRLMKEAAPAANSKLVRFIASHDYASTIVVSHIRHASHGGICYDNTHPFTRELGGVEHVFCHNGGFEGAIAAFEPRLERFRPCGDTDTELGFCAMLTALSDLWRDRETRPSLEDRTAVVAAYAETFADMGSANFLYSDGEVLFAHSNWRPLVPGGPERLPGLHLLECPAGTTSPHVDAPGIHMEGTDERQAAILLASVPLNEDEWEPLPERTLLVIRKGELLERIEHGAGERAGATAATRPQA